MILTLYSTGMRVSELTHLKVVDIDNKRMLIRIDQGKNKKDRYVKLSEKLLVILRQYWSAEKCKPSTWLFPGYGTDTPLGRNSVALMMRKARAKSGIRKPVTAPITIPDLPPEQPARPDMPATEFGPAETAPALPPEVPVVPPKKP